MATRAKRTYSEGMKKGLLQVRTSAIREMVALPDTSAVRRVLTQLDIPNVWEKMVFPRGELTPVGWVCLTIEPLPAGEVLEDDGTRGVTYLDISLTHRIYLHKSYWEKQDVREQLFLALLD